MDNGANCATSTYVLHVCFYQQKTGMLMNLMLSSLRSWSGQWLLMFHTFQPQQRLLCMKLQCHQWYLFLMLFLGLMFHTFQHQQQLLCNKLQCHQWYLLLLLFHGKIG
jgi:hypothetical protein